ncbi:MAG: MerR family transcriptional regulator [Acidobacteriota bacterium]
MRIDAVLRQPEFGLRETAGIIGTSPEALKAWCKRSLVPLPLKPVGTGHRRRYSAWDLLVLRIQRLVLPYVGQRQAPLIAADCARVLVEQYWPQTTGGEFPGALLVISRRQFDYGVDLVAPDQLATFLGESALTVCDRAALLAHVPADRRADVKRDLERRTLIDPEARLVLDARAIVVGTLARIHEVVTETRARGGRRGR